MSHPQDPQPHSSDAIFCSGSGVNIILAAQIYLHNLHHQCNSEQISIKGRVEEIYVLLNFFPGITDIDSCAFQDCFKILQPILC